MARMAVTREQFLPKVPGVIVVRSKMSATEAHLYKDTLGRPCARVFTGRKARPDIRCFYRTENAREIAVRAFFERQDRYAAEKAARNVKLPHDLKVGDILFTSWGYDCTVYDFYKVVEVKSEKTVVVQELAATRTYTKYGYDTAPVIDVFADGSAPLTVRASVQDGDLSIKIDGHYGRRHDREIYHATER